MLRRFRGVSAPFVPAALGAAKLAKRNKGPLLGCGIVVISALMLIVIIIMRSNTIAIEFAASEMVEDIKDSIQQSMRAKNSPEISKRVPISRGDTYAMNTEEFINDIKRTDRNKIFEWHLDGASGVHFAIYTPPKPLMKILVVGQLHARELYSADMARFWMASIMAQTPTLLRDYVEVRNHSLSEWVFVPVANPCGRDLVTEAYTTALGGGGGEASSSNPNVTWRLCHRGNCDGVDLNRNWITYGSSLYRKTSSLRLRRGRFWDGTPETNPGPEAFSEPESKFLRGLVHEIKPDLVISLHTGGVGFLHPPEDRDTETDIHSKFSPERLSILRRLAGWGRMKTQIKPREQRHMEDAMVPVAGGSLLDYCVRHDVPLAFTLELYVNETDSIYGPSPPEYRGSEHWGDSPLNCHRFYNPPQTLLLDSANRWLRFWKALFYLKPSERAFFVGLLGWQHESQQPPAPSALP